MTDATDQERGTAIVTKLAAAWNSRSPEQVVQLCSPDTTWHIPGVADELKGPEAVRDWVEGFFATLPDVVFDYPAKPPLFSPDGDRVAVEWRLNGTMTGPIEPPGFAPTGHTITDQGVDVLTLDAEDRIVDYRMVFDMLEVARQIGAAPEPGSRAERFGVLMQHRAAKKLRKQTPASR